MSTNAAPEVDAVRGRIGDDEVDCCEHGRCMRTCTMSASLDVYQWGVENAELMNVR